MKIKKRKNRGFLLLEAIIATSIFAISITGIVFAIQATADLTTTMERERWVQKQFKNILDEALKSTRSQEEFEQGLSVNLGEFGAQGVVEVSPSTLTNEEGLELENLYDVKVTITWYDNDNFNQATINTLHLYPLYQPR